MSRTVAALFVTPTSIYKAMPGVEAYDEARDAFTYRGPWPVVCHSPCGPWGRYYHGGPSAKVRRVKGDDGGAFAFALASVRRWGGVLEHPEASSAWAHFGIVAPPMKGGWVRAFPSGDQGWTCCVFQRAYGHKAAKATWLLYIGETPPPSLPWGRLKGARLDEGFHTAAERKAARAAGVKPIPRTSTRDNLATPPAFAELLVSMARAARSLPADSSTEQRGPGAPAKATGQPRERHLSDPRDGCSYCGGLTGHDDDCDVLS